MGNLWLQVVVMVITIVIVVMVVIVTGGVEGDIEIGNFSVNPGALGM